jgi:ethanolamine permease
VALIVPGTIGFLLAALVSAAVGPDLAGARMIQIAVFGATVSYILMTLSHIVLRRREPDLERPYRTPGGVATTGVAFVLACAALVAVFQVDVTAALITLGVFVAFLAYFWFYSRHHLVGVAPEEEFEAISKAESELK